jgi:hypothetical protein
MWSTVCGAVDKWVDLVDFFSVACASIYVYCEFDKLFFSSFRVPPQPLKMFDPLGGHPRILLTCPTCFQQCRTPGGLAQHRNSAHRQFTPESDDDGNNPVSTYEYHPHLTGIYIHIFSHIKCNEAGEYLLPHTAPQALPDFRNGGAADSWKPFSSRVEFDFAHYHFVEAQSSASLIDQALDLWAATVMDFGGTSSWKSSGELYATIDAINCSDSPWKTYKIRYLNISSRRLSLRTKST